MKVPLILYIVEYVIPSTKSCDISVDIAGTLTVVGEGVHDYDADGAYHDCDQPSSCIGGYDAGMDGNGATCEQTPQGYYSEKDSKIRLSCLDTPTISLTNLPLNALWDSGPGLTQHSDCTWACNADYKVDDVSSPTSCVPAESVNSFIIVDLKTATDSSSNEKKGINTGSLTLEITGTNVRHWYVTHDSTFVPSSTSDVEAVGGRSWTSSISPPTSYELPNLDGEYTLYLWIADSQGRVKLQAATTSETFTLDTQNPTINSVTPPSSAVIGDLTASFLVSMTEENSGLGVTYSYCVGRDCDDDFEEVTPDNAGNVDVDTSEFAGGVHYITFKVEDWLDNSAQEANVELTLTECSAGNMERESHPAFEHGVRERTCSRQ